MANLLFQDLNGGVSIIVPSKSSGVPSAHAMSMIPNDAARTFIEHDFMLPVDHLFRPAWTWDGESRFVIEDLEKSKAIATAAVKASTLEAAKNAASANFFNEPAALSEEEIKSACNDCMADIDAAEDPYEVKLLMCAFCGQSEPELPRDEQLRIKAEEAKARIKTRLQEIAAAVKAWYAEKVPTVGAMPAPTS